ncbi:MAG: class I SAM-dependent methyltransferase [Bacteroidetes bacterium]|nr:class I SAM-dependent methyltransferase [Bacteroidota bacterium]
MEVIYNTIGQGYNATRKADPYIAERLYQLLLPEENGIYLDIGCGTGNYLQAMINKGLDMKGIDPSDIMLDAARGKQLNTELIKAYAHDIPFPKGYFNGAMAILTIHHWSNRQTGMNELRRVIKPGGRLVFFSFTPQQTMNYWLHHYFPRMITQAASIVPTLDEMKDILTEAGFGTTETELYYTKEDLQDHFMYAHKHKPEMYLQQEARDGMSAFRLAPDGQEIADGLEKLRTDIASGEITNIIKKYENDLGDYLFIVAR